MIVIALSLLAAAIAVAIEGLSRRASWFFDWWGLMPAMQFTLGYLLYRMQQMSPNLVMTFVVFSACTLTLRAALSVWMGLPLGGGTWVAVVLLYAAVAVRFYWR